VVSVASTRIADLKKATVNSGIKVQEIGLVTSKGFVVDAEELIALQEAEAVYDNALANYLD